MLEISVVRGVGGVFGSGRYRWRGGEWMSELGMGFTNPVGTGGVLDMCLCFGCGDVGRALGPAVGWCYVCVSLDFLCRWQVQVSVYCAWRFLHI